MRTLHFDFHMGSVACVTCHVPSIQSSAGGSVDGSEAVAPNVEGARNLILGAFSILSFVVEIINAQHELVEEEGLQSFNPSQRVVCRICPRYHTQ